MNKASLVLALASLGILSGGQAAHAASPLVLASIGLFGPNGEVISYEKEGNTIHLRVCQKNTLASEISADQGCQLADGTSEVVMSESDFRGLVNTGLAKIDKSQLSQQQKTLLERDLTDLPSLDDKRKQLGELQKQLQRLEDFKAQNPQDYDANDERRLKDQIQCIKDSLSGYGDIIDAKNQVAGIVDSLLVDMNGKPLRRTLKHSSDGNGIAYNLLRSLASVDACDPGKVSKAPSGYMCRAGTVMWKVENDTYAGKRVYRDMKSGLKVTEPLDGTSNQYNAGARCNNGYRLPSGYPSSINGQYGFPNQDSDFTALESDNIRQVVPGMSSHWFWSSSVVPDVTYYAYVFSGNYGGIGDGSRDYNSGAALCVAGGR